MKTGDDAPVLEFHNVLCRNVFRQLARSGVVVEFWACDKRAAQVMADIKPEIATLFTPWLARGILDLRFTPDARP